MSKARTLADFISDGGDFADGSISVSEVSGAAPLASPTFTGTASGTFSGPLTGDVSGDLDLPAISAAINKDAKDIFVYDTRKDSDGGAWRKRTQHTSWYNETLNTSTRGSRKEFPAVALIVAENDTLTIHDADDPDLPMWMVFNADAYTFMAPTNRETSRIAMLNGILCVGRKNSAGFMSYISFVDDTARAYSGNANEYRDWLKPISDRNTTDAYVSSNSAYSIVNDQIQDVAMTVLPNAPIDSATGLPIPTIAVVTSGGVSVIKDDGTIISSSHSYASTARIAITPDGLLYASHNGPTSGQSLEVIDLLTLKRLNTGTGNNAPFHGTNTVGGQHRYYGYGANLTPTSHNMPFLLPKWGRVGELAVTKDHVVIGGDSDNFFGSTNSGTHAGIIRIAEEPSNPANGMVNLTSTGYNTGWLVGDTKLATLSSTSTAAVDSSNLLDSADDLVPSSNAHQFTLGVGSASTSTAGGFLTLQIMPNGQHLPPGKYEVTFTVDALVQYGFWANSSTEVNFFTAGTHTFTFTQEGQTQAGWTLYNWTGSFTNVSVTQVAEETDYSVYNNPLTINGTVTKTPVATGAELVAYSGFSDGTNYLEQPYNSDLDFGTGDFCVIGWFKNSALSDAYVHFLDNGYPNTEYFSCGMVQTSGDVTMRLKDNAGQDDLTTSSLNLDDGTWHQYCFVRRGLKGFIYVDGQVKVTQVISNRNLTGTSDVLSVGVRGDGIRRNNGYLSLWRISGTAPSPEQIKKIYEDEKALFQEGAQATIYGTSGIIGAMDYDESTDLLHVGTEGIESADLQYGRSVFKGLRRVDNTTNMVRHAISAVNGLVADD